MAASSLQIARIRRMTVEPVATSTYSDEDIAAYIEAYPLPDDLGRKPWTKTVLAEKELDETPSTYWTPTYDLNAAAADIWEEKAAALVANGAVYETDSAHRQAMRQVRYFRAKRSVKTIELSPDPSSSDVEELLVDEIED